jgi:hypothetical protein
MNKKSKLNRERILLVSLVAVAFFGFLLWSIQQTRSEEESLLSDQIDITNPVENSVIKISSPKVSETIKNPLIISGQADTSAGGLMIRIKDSKNMLLASSAALTTNAKKMSSFSLTLRYKKPTSQKGFIEIFEISSTDKTEIHKLSIPITFAD